MLNMSHNEQIASISVFSLSVLAVIFRIILVVSFASGIAFINLQCKNIKNKADIEKLPNILFGKIAKEYAHIAKTMPGAADAYSIARLSVIKNKLLFFNFSSLATFIETLEGSVLLLSILFAIIAGPSIYFLIFVVVIYVLSKILAAIFDSKSAEMRYIDILAHSLNTNIGMFFPSDSTSAVTSFSADMQHFLEQQSKMYQDILLKINNEFTSSIKSATVAMTKSVEATMAAVVRQDGLTAAVDKLANQVEVIVVANKEIEHSQFSLKEVLEDFSKILNNTKDAISLYSQNIELNAKNTKSDIVLLVDAIEKIGNTSQFMVTNGKLLEQEMGLIKSNQQLLETSVASYELSLKELTAQIGDILGKIIGHHLASTNDLITEGVSNNLRLSHQSNSELISRVKDIFDELLEQSRYQTSILRNNMDVNNPQN